MQSRKKKFELFPRKYGFFPYVFLIYLFMPAYNLYLESGWKRLIGYMLLSLFLVTYRQLYFCTKSFTKWLFLQLSIVLILSIFFSINHLFLGFFPANFIGWYCDKKKFNQAFLLFVLMIIIPIIVHFEALYDKNTLYFFLPFIVIMLISPFGIRSMNDRMKLERKLEQANETIHELVKREERMRIARDLHDTLGHTLSFITLKSQLVGKLVMKDSEKALEEVKEIERTSRAALTQVRELVSDMRAMTVAEELLEAKSILETAQITFHFTGNTKLEEVSALTQNILSMCLREAVTNVVKHSDASHCFININEKEGEMIISVRDDGKGANNNKKGNGLKGMAERLNFIDGTLNLTSKDGTELVITVPVVMRGREGVLYYD